MQQLIDQQILLLEGDADGKKLCGLKQTLEVSLEIEKLRPSVHKQSLWAENKTNKNLASFSYK